MGTYQDEKAKIGTTYILKSKSGDVVAKLVDIKTFPYTGMPPSYILEHISGDDAIVKASSLPGKLFPFPSLLFAMIDKEILDT